MCKNGVVAETPPRTASGELTPLPRHPPAGEGVCCLFCSWY